MGKSINGLEVRNSTLGPLVSQVTARAYIATVFMRGNQITDLAPDTFAGSEEHIGRLDLSSNMITRVNFAVFNNFTNMHVKRERRRLETISRNFSLEGPEFGRESADQRRRRRYGAFAASALLVLEPNRHHRTGRFQETRSPRVFGFALEQPASSHAQRVCNELETLATSPQVQSAELA